MQRDSEKLAELRADVQAAYNTWRRKADGGPNQNPYGRQRATTPGADTARQKIIRRAQDAHTIAAQRLKDYLEQTRTPEQRAAIEAARKAKQAARALIYSADPAEAEAAERIIEEANETIERNR